MTQARDKYKRCDPENGLPPVHPGEYITEDLAAMAMSPTDFDVALALPPGTIADIVAERCSVTPDVALRLSRYLGTSARLWMNLQVSYDLKVAEHKHGAAIAKQVTPRKDHVSELKGDYK